MYNYRHNLDEFLMAFLDNIIYDLNINERKCIEIEKYDKGGPVLR